MNRDKCENDIRYIKMCDAIRGIISEIQKEKDNISFDFGECKEFPLERVIDRHRPMTVEMILLKIQNRRRLKCIGR